MLQLVNRCEKILQNTEHTQRQSERMLDTGAEIMVEIKHNINESCEILRSIVKADERIEELQKDIKTVYDRTAVNRQVLINFIASKKYRVVQKSRTKQKNSISPLRLE